MPDFARSAVRAVIQLAVDDQAPANTGPDENRQHLPIALARAELVLAESRRADVIFDKHRLATQTALELGSHGQIDPSEVGRDRDDGLGRIEWTWHADSEGFHRFEWQLGFGGGGACAGGQAIEQLVGSSAQISARQPDARPNRAIRFDDSSQCLGAAQIDRDHRTNRRTWPGCSET
jgi:hypothetical protein